MLINLANTKDFSSLIKDNKHVLVDFYATWCGPCRMLGPVLEELSEDLPELTIVKVNVDDHPEIAGMFRVSAIPTMIEFVDEKSVNTFVGFLSKDDLKDRLSK